MKKYNYFKTKADRRKFYLSKEWRNIREVALERDKHECVRCRAEGKVTTRQDMVLEIDHIEELQGKPGLALDISNLQTL